MTKPTYQLINEPHVAIRCLRCGLISYLLYDIAKLYCGNCQMFHEPVDAEPG